MNALNDIVVVHVGLVLAVAVFVRHKKVSALHVVLHEDRVRPCRNGLKPLHVVHYGGVRLLVRLDERDHVDLAVRVQLALVVGCARAELEGLAVREAAPVDVHGVERRLLCDAERRQVLVVKVRNVVAHKDELVARGAVDLVGQARVREHHLVGELAQHGLGHLAVYVYVKRNDLVPLDLHKDLHRPGLPDEDDVIRDDGGRHLWGRC